MPVDEALYEYATDVERRALDAIKEYGHARAAERALGLGNDTISKAVRRLKARAAKSGYAPGHFEWGTAPGYHMGKVTVQRGADGEVERVWERQLPDQARLAEAMEEAVAAMAEAITPVAPLPAPTGTTTALCTLYTFTDYHVGMLAWHEEGGADWDVSIAEATGIAAMQAMVAGSPASDTAVISIKGDFVHYDGFAPVTPTHGHVLDADSRFGKVVKVSIRLIRQLVSLALQKHRSVILVISEGNHDLASSLWLRNLFAALYEDEPRISVHDSELPYFALEWGNVMLGFHHGHLSKNAALPTLFAAQFREMWGRCSKVYIHTGHRHHREVKEHPGAVVIQHPTLAARDAYAARGGWFSERAITAITYHRLFGEVGTVTVTPEMIQ